jgi:outer membrane murein-binding lipoprotein Lpp
MKIALIPLGILLLAGCKSAVEYRQSATLDAFDLQSMTDDMAMKIAADPDVQAAQATKGSLKIVVLPVVNALTAEVIPPGQAEAFTARVRVLLQKQARDKYTWIMNRRDFDLVRNRELAIDLGPSPDAIDPEYALTATFRSITDETRKSRQAYYLCSYELTNLKDRTLLWTGTYEVKKTAAKGFLD